MSVEENQQVACKDIWYHIEVIHNVSIKTNIKKYFEYIHTQIMFVALF